MRLWNSITKATALAGLLIWASHALGATYNLSNGQRPYCSTYWDVSGSTYRCANNGRITLPDGDNIIANSDATLVANNGFNLGNGTIGSSSIRIDLQSSYGDIDADGTTIYGDLNASSGDIDLEDAEIRGAVQTGGDIDLDNTLVSGDVTSDNNEITARDSTLQGDVQARGDIDLSGGSVSGKVTSTSNRIDADNTDLLGGAEARGNIRVEGGILTGDFTSTNNRIFFTSVTMTEGDITGGEVTITDSDLGGSTGVVNATAFYGSVDLVNSSVVYGDLNAPSWSEINVSDDSQVFGTCTPASPGCINRPPVNCPLNTGLEGEYFDGTDLNPPAAFSRIDSQIDFNWGGGSPNNSALGNNGYSVRWVGYLRAPKDAPFTLATRSDDGVRLTLDEFLVIDNWTNHSATVDQVNVDLDEGEYYRLELEYYENSGQARIELLWDITDDGNTNLTPVPTSYLSHCNAIFPTPVLEWRMDEAYWSGSTDEVADSSGNDHDGTGGGDIDTVSGYLCRAGEFDGVDDYIRSPALYDALKGTATFSFWIKTTAVGNDTPYLAPGISGIEEAGGTDDIFWGWLDGSGHIGLAVGNSSDGSSNQAINDGVFHHVVIIRNASNGNYRIYIDGALDTSGRMASGEIGNYFESLGRVENTDGGPNYFQGQLDEVSVFEQQLTNGEVQLLYDLQRQGKNLDSTDRDLSNCGGVSLSCVNQNFNTGLDSDTWQISSKSGGFTPQIIGGRLRLTDDRNDAATAATLLRQFPSAGNRVVVEFDYYAYTDDGDDDAADGVAVVLSNSNTPAVAGGFGGSLGYAQNTNAGENGFAGGWLGVGLDVFGNYSNDTEGRQGGPGQRPNAVAVRGSGDGTTGYNYLAGTSADLSPGLLTGSSSGQRYRITVDHSDSDRAQVTVERDSNNDGIFETLVGPFDALDDLSQAAIPESVILTLTGSTGASSANNEIDDLEVCATVSEPYEPPTPIHHFELVRNRTNGLTCEPLNVEIRACTDAACSSQYSGQFDASLTATRLTDNAVTSVSGSDLSSGDSLGLLLPVAGDYQLALPTSSPTVESVVDNRCFIGGSTSAEDDCEFTVNDTGLRFFDVDTPGISQAQFDLVAGRSEGPIAVQAVQTNETTGICEGLFSPGETLDFTAGTNCSDPNECSVGEDLDLDMQVTFSQGSTDTKLPNPENPILGQATRTLQLTFGTEATDPDSTARFNLNAPDVGIQALTLAYELPNAGGAPSGTVISETVNLRVRPASLRLQNIANDDGDALPVSVSADADSDAFALANQPFVVSVQALNDNGDPTPNFGRTSSLPELNWANSSRAYPTTGASGALVGSEDQLSPADDWQSDTNDSSRIILNNADGLRFTDLGVLRLEGHIDAYLGAPAAVTSDTPLVGRFVPATLGVSQVGTAKWGDLNYIYQGQQADLSDLALEVTAYDANGTAVNNYDGDLFKLDMNQAGLLQRPLTSTGDSLLYPTPTTWPQPTDADADYDGSVQLSMSNLALTWPRNASGPGANDVPQDVDTLLLGQLDALEADGVCTDPCTTQAFTINARNLLYGRLNSEQIASGDQNQVLLPIRVEYLAAVDATDSSLTFDTQTDDSHSQADLSGLSHNSSEDACNISPSQNCQTDIAGQATGPFHIDLSATPPAETAGLQNGEGYYRINPVTDINGLVGVTVNAPDWLEWDWNGDGDETGPRSVLSFGQYSGRPPVLFQVPGVR